MLMDTEQWPVLNPSELNKFNDILQSTKLQAEPEQKKIQEKYIELEVPKLVEAALKRGSELPFEDAVKTVQARCEGGKHRDLYKDDILIFDKYGDVFVGEVLENFEKYDQSTVRDPQEPELGRGKAKLYFNKKEQKPFVNSWAHGGIKYFLHAESAFDAEQIFNDILQWISTTADDRAILGEWLKKIKGLNSADVDAIKNAVQKKTDVKVSILNKDLKGQKAEGAKARAKARAKETSRKRAEIGIKEIMYHPTATGEFCHKVSEALRDHPEKKIYRFAGNLIKIVNRQPSTVRMVKKIHDLGGQYPSMPTINQFSKETLCHEAEKVAVCQSIDAEGNIKDMPWPKNILAGVMALTECHEKPLVGIVEHPYIDDNFRPVLTQGYDDATGLYKVFDVVPDIGFFKDSEDALVYLIDELLKDFPFSSDVDQMAAVSCLLTGMQRKLIADNSGCPGYIFTAPVQSSGKTTLCQGINYSLYGRPAAATSFSDDDTEMAKHLLGILQEGISAVLFDNLPEGSVVESNELAKAITSDSYSNRWLGKNKTITAPSCVLWMMTGNNISVCGDFNTRFLKVELDTKNQNPDQRRFKREDIGAWCDQHRGKILGACMKIIMDGKGYSNPDLNPTRFPSWDKFVRLPLFKTSGIDIAEIFQKNKLSDPKIEGQNNFFEAWFNAFGPAATTAKRVLDHCRLVTDQERFSGLPDDNEMGEAMKDIFTGVSLPSTRALGKWLTGMKNRFFGEYNLIHAGIGTNRAQVNKALWVVLKK